MSELESAMNTMAEAAAALEAAKAAVVPNKDENKKTKKRVSKKNSDPEANTSPKATFESITRELINDTSELLAKEIPAIAEVDNNPFENVEIPVDF
jgi:RNA polymerase-binding transcription factor DksA